MGFLHHGICSENLYSETLLIVIVAVTKRKPRKAGTAAKTNAELVDDLVLTDCIKSRYVEKAFLAVDRALYHLAAHRQNAYNKDQPWKAGNLHLSSPVIYALVLETLRLGPGMSFLNLGSGTGYLSTLAGLILGE